MLHRSHVSEGCLFARISSNEAQWPTDAPLVAAILPRFPSWMSRPALSPVSSARWLPRVGHREAHPARTARAGSATSHGVASWPIRPSLVSQSLQAPSLVTGRKRRVFFEFHTTRVSVHRALAALSCLGSVLGWRSIRAGRHGCSPAHFLLLRRLCARTGES